MLSGNAEKKSQGLENWDHEKVDSANTESADCASSEELDSFVLTITYNSKRRSNEPLSDKKVDSAKNIQATKNGLGL